MEIRIKVIILLSVSVLEIVCRGIPEEEAKVVIPADLLPKKEAIFWQRQLVILFVPNNFGVNGLGGLGGVTGGLPIGGGVPIGGVPGTGFSARNRQLERIRALRRRNRLRTRTTTPSFESDDSENK